MGETRRMIQICSHHDCHLPAESNQLCPGHRTQHRRGGPLTTLRINRPDHCHVRNCHQPATPDTPGWCAHHLNHADPTIWATTTRPPTPQIITGMPCTTIKRFTELAIGAQIAACQPCPARHQCLTLGITEARHTTTITWTYGGATPTQLYALATATKEAAAA